MPSDDEEECEGSQCDDCDDCDDQDYEGSSCCWSEDSEDALRRQFAEADLDGDGYISRDEMRSLLQATTSLSEEECDEMFDQLDQDGNGKLCFDEFVNWLMDDGEEEGDETVTPVSLDEWLVMAKDMDGLGAADARELFEFVQEEYTDEVPEEEGKVFLCDLLLEFGFEFDDDRAVRHVIALMKRAKTAVEGGAAPSQEEQEEESGEVALQSGLGKLTQAITFQGGNPEDVASFLAEGKAKLTKSEQAAIGQLSSEELAQRAAAANEEPPAVNACAGQLEVRRRCAEEVNAIIQACRESGEPFRDPEWNVDEEDGEKLALWVDKEKPGHDCTVAKPAGWKRITEIFESSKLIHNKNAPSAIVQGQCGDCFLLGAMDAFVANNPRNVEQIFIKYDVEVGVYGVRFCINGEWGYVIVDDRVAVDEDGEILYMGMKNRQDLWGPLLEKAYCKLHTCFEMCDGGHSTESIACFFGGVSGTFKITPKDKKKPGEYFKKLKNARANGMLLFCGFVAGEDEDGEGEGGGTCGEDCFSNGLIGGHAYSVLKVVESGGNQLVCCRNPWGSGEWKGRWSDGSGEWTDAMKKACGGHVDEDDGRFWMCIEDFVKLCENGVDYGRTFGPEWTKNSAYGKFNTGKLTAEVLFDFEATDETDVPQASAGEEVTVSDACGGWCTVAKTDGDMTGMMPLNYLKIKNLHLIRYDVKATIKDGFEGKHSQRVVIMLMQQNILLKRRFNRKEGLAHKHTEYPSIFLVVVTKDGTVLAKRQATERCLWKEVEVTTTKVPDGEFSVFLGTTVAAGAPFTLRTYSSQGLDVTLRRAECQGKQELPAGLSLTDLEQEEGDAEAVG